MRITILFFLFAFNLANSQDSICFPTSGVIDFEGYKKTGKIDTVKIVILITECEVCTAKSVFAYAIREQSSYYGDRMPGSDYSDLWIIKSYLDNKRKPFTSKVIVWDNRKLIQ